MPTALASAALTALAGALLGAPVESGTIELAPRADRRDRIELPAPVFHRVGAGIPVAHAGGSSFLTAVDGTTLRLDTDGDGVLDRDIAAPSKPGAVARVMLSGHDADGTPIGYPLRLRLGQAGWEWIAGGAMVGAIGETKIQLIDQNGNGRFDDWGADAMIVGRGSTASFLSRVINVRDRLFAIDVRPDGRRLEFRPYDGPAGRLDMTAGFSSEAKLLSLVVRSADGRHSFDLGSSTGTPRVPAGTYSVATGTLGLGAQTVKVRAGRMAPITVAANDAAGFTWGGPVLAEFEYGRQGDEVIFSPDHIWYYGAAGEEYFGWQPIGKSPEFTIADGASGETLEVAILPGSS